MYRMHIGTIVVCVGSSTVPAIRSFGWQYNASNGVVFRRQIGTESCLYDHITFVYTFQHWQFFLCAYGSSKSQLAEGRAARVYYNSSTVPATGSFGWQYNASNGVIFRRQIGTESCLYNHVTFVHIFQHWQFFLCAYGSSKSRLAEGRAARVYCNSSTVPATGRSGGSTVPAQGRFRRQIGTESCRFSLYA